MNRIIDRIKRRCGRRESLRWSMVRMLLFGWFFPLLMLILIIVFLVTKNNYNQVEHTIMSSMDKTMDMMKMQLKACETASKNASYMAVIARCYERYLEDRNEIQFAKDVNSFLVQQYAYDDNLKSAELVVLDDTRQNYYALNNSNGGTRLDVRFFNEKVKDIVLKAASTLDTGTTLVGVEGRVYMVRNLVNSKFVPYAVLSLELDSDSLMKSYAGIWGYDDACLYWNGEVMLAGRHEQQGGEKIEQHSADYIGRALGTRTQVYEYGRNGHSHAYCQIKIYDGTLLLAVSLNNSVTHAEMATMYYVFLILLILMIPLIIQVMRFFYKKVTVPLGQLIIAANEVREGNLGFRIENKEKNEEFYQMKESFNHMSQRLKNQFDKIYLEEVALRDARIMALQSQINPHFLNNTLEIINWEARLTGNYKVSGMIEALSTMLEETMNRKAKQFHSVAEEMAYADAYLFIISQRFGSKFRCTKHIDERLMDVQVPRLIIQPIVENAVEHGMDIARQGRLEIRLFEREDGYLCIEVEDNGRLTKKDKERIDRLLSQEETSSGEKRVSLGIRNVDQRLKMIYGKDCGLFINGDDKDNTISTILIKTVVPDEQ